MRLTKGMFGHEFRPNKDGPFGLSTGQMRCGGITHNSGWYNSAGEKLGWGDLDTGDMKRIRDNLQAGDVFIILGETDSFWNFVSRFGMLGSMCKTQPTVEAPGRDYVEQKMCYLITQQEVIQVVDHSREQNSWTVGSITFLPMLRQVAVKIARRIVDQWENS